GLSTQNGRLRGDGWDGKEPGCAILLRMTPGESMQGRAPIVRWAWIAYSLLAAVALAWNAWAGRPWAYLDPAAAASGVRRGRGPGLGLACAGAGIAVSHVLTAWTRWGAALVHELASALGPLTLAECVVLAALSGFAEELFFRGALQPRVG